MFWWCDGRINNILFFRELLISSLIELSLPISKSFGKIATQAITEWTTESFWIFVNTRTLRTLHTRTILGQILNDWERKSPLAQNQKQKSHAKDKTRHFPIFYFTGWRTDLFSIEFFPGQCALIWVFSANTFINLRSSLLRYCATKSSRNKGIYNHRGVETHLIKSHLL